VRLERVLGISIAVLQVLFMVVVFLVGYSTVATVMASLPSGGGQEGGKPFDLRLGEAEGGARVITVAFPVHNEGLLPVDIRVRVRLLTQAGVVLAEEESSRHIPAGHSESLELTFTISDEKLEQVSESSARAEGMIEYKTLYGLVSASASVQMAAAELRQGER